MIMNAKKPMQDKEEDPSLTIKVNVSMTRGTSDILKEVAKFKHVTSSSVVTNLIRTEAERIGLLPLTVKDTPQKEIKLKSLPAAARPRLLKTN